MPYKDKLKQREFQRAWIAKRRSEFFNNKKCAKCGVSDDLELDHVDPEKKIHHAIWSWSDKRREKEISKCQTLCSECHQLKTNLDRGCVYEHGSSYFYKVMKCRCKMCRAWKAKQSATERLERSTTSVPRITRQLYP